VCVLMYVCVYIYPLHHIYGERAPVPTSLYTVSSPTCNHSVLPYVGEHSITLAGGEAYEKELLVVHGGQQQGVGLLSFAALVHLCV